MGALGWKRLVSAAVDGVVIAVVGTAVHSMLGVGMTGGIDPWTGDPERGGRLLGFIVSWLLFGAVGGAYFAWLHGGARGQSLGKIATRTRVRDAATGGPIGPERALLRFGASWLAWLLYVPGLLDLLSPFLDARRRAWHDRIARTIVVDA